MTKFHDIPYLLLVEDVIKTGHHKTDRTGTGTISTFSKQMRFDLSDGSIPLLTTKKMHVRSIIQEILWYLKGRTNTQYLTDNKVTIWDEWADTDGNLGPIYGSMWRHWPIYEKHPIVEVPIKTFAGIDLPFSPPDDSEHYKPKFLTEGCLGIIKHKPSYYKKAFELWILLLQEQNKRKKFPKNTKNFTFLDQSWRCFANFLRDITELPHFHSWLENNKDYMLTRNYYASKCWGRNTCIFVKKQQHE